MLVESGRKQFFALSEARSIKYVRQEHYKTDMSNNYGFAHIGIIAIDDTQAVTAYNKAAEVYGIEASELSDNLLPAIPNTSCLVLETGCPELGVQKVRGGTVATNRVPIKIEGRTIGAVATFGVTTKEVEQKIRHKTAGKALTKHKLTDILGQMKVY